MKTVGILTIGQSPRDDVVPEIEKLLGPEFRVLQAGALDGLDAAGIVALAPGAGQYPLVTRLRDASSVIVAKEAIVPRLQACIERLEGEAQAFVIQCVGAFPAFRTRRPVLLPDRLLAAAAQAVFDGGRLGVLAPIAEQRQSMAARWSALDPGVVVAVASPYADPGAPGALVGAAEELRRAGTTLVIMACAGYTADMKAVVTGVTGAPALLPASLIARFLAELV
jgi:protein AroM